MAGDNYQHCISFSCKKFVTQHHLRDSEGYFGKNNTAEEQQPSQSL